jgi:N-acyl-L-homoserine lactone synthetase
VFIRSLKCLFLIKLLNKSKVNVKINVFNIYKLYWEMDKRCPRTSRMWRSGRFLIPTIPRRSGQPTAIQGSVLLSMMVLVRTLQIVWKSKTHLCTSCLMEASGHTRREKWYETMLSLATSRAQSSTPILSSVATWTCSTHTTKSELSALAPTDTRYSSKSQNWSTTRLSATVCR